MAIERWKAPSEHLAAMRIGLAVVQRKHKPRQSIIGPLCQDCHELYAIVQGQLEIRCGRTDRVAQSGSVALFLRGRTYSIRPSTDYRGPVRIVSILFRASAKWKVAWDGAPERLPEIWCRRLLALESSCEFDEYAQRVLAVRSVMDFVEDLAHQLPGASTGAASGRGHTATHWLQTWMLAEDIIRERARDGLTVEELSRSVCVSPTQLRRIFRATRRTSPKQALTAHRIEVAKKLLAAGSHTVSQVASEVGYSTVQRFSAAFKSCVGVSPSLFTWP